MAEMPKGTLVEQTPIGGLRIFVTPPGQKRQEITEFRGAPVNVLNTSIGDPFSEETAVLSTPQITPFETLGEGDLAWVIEGADVDIVWQNLPGATVTYNWTWEGYISSFDFSVSESSTSFQIQLKGALLALDDYLAIPTYPAAPLPYEFLIRSAFDPEQHPCSLNPIVVTFPDDWDTIAPASNDPNYANPLLRPYGVLTGAKWTGLTSRSTGNWNPCLSGFVASLLQVMYTADGSQWTIVNRGGRSPEMKVRRRPDNSDTSILNVDLGAPGVDVSLSKDYSQAVNVLYGAGTDAAGVAYSGMQMSPDGRSVSYQPFAANPAAWPRDSDAVLNPLYDGRRKSRESFISFQQGLSQPAAQAVAQGQLQRFNDPGLTGTITLGTDAYLSDTGQTTFYRMLIKAGQTIRLKNVLGNTAGVLFHITEVSMDWTNLKATLTVDSKYRDVLTVDEVYNRTRDPLATLHTLQNAAQSNVLQDLLLPWSYADGSGSIPYSATAFYAKLPATASFPYEDFTKANPPSSHPEYYVRLGPVDRSDPHNNWVKYDSSAFTGDTATGIVGIPILLSQKGTAALTQLAAYDRDGNVLPVKFHFSLYTNNGVQIDDMPHWSTYPFARGSNSSDPATWKMPPILDNTSYKAPSKGTGDPRDGITLDWAQWAGHVLGDIPSGAVAASFPPHPFFQGAWQEYDEQGHLLTGVTGGPYMASEGAGLVVGWGTYFQPAGFWPGKPPGGVATGMLQDSTAWAWDTGQTLNAQSTNPLQSNVGAMNFAGCLFGMIYCEDQGNQEVFFLGRIFDQPAGSGS